MDTLKPHDLKSGDAIRNKNGELWVVVHVFPEKVVARRVIDVFDFSEWEKVNLYGETTKPKQ